MSKLVKKIETIKNFTVYAHDLRTKDETSEFKIKAKSKDEAMRFFTEDFPQKYWKLQDIEED